MGRHQGRVSHITRWEKVAVVTEKDRVRHSIEIFGYLIPGEVKGFTADEQSTARTWVCA